MGVSILSAGQPPKSESEGDRMLAAYFRAEAAKLENRGLADVATRADWESRRADYRSRLLAMLGLAPLPPRTELHATVTGSVEVEEVRVEKLHFQSSPRLYVTANLYRPARLDGPAPTILYLCGHNRDHPRFGNKVGYHHYGVWFAKHGYVCLMLDTLQLGEIQGVHDGAHRKGRFWWYNLGYTPAGVEVWNAIRALDYLESRPEVDASRIGITGRSGGGGYSWYTAAVDERVRVAVPVSGMTDLHAQVVENIIGRHCDCMFPVNSHRWDFATVGALIAPRPLLLGNGDRETSYPLAGVIRFQSHLRRVYEWYGRKDDFALMVGPGEHQDTPELQLATFRWFNRHLKGDTAAVSQTATKLFTPEQLKVFARLPPDELNTTIDERFVSAVAPVPVPPSTGEWNRLRDGWRSALREHSFQGWPREAEPLAVGEGRAGARSGRRVQEYEFTSQGPVRLGVTLVRFAGGEPASEVILTVLDQPEWEQWRREVDSGAPAGNERAARAWFAPRGIGPTRWDQTHPNPTQVKRRFMLLGQTLEAMQVWDVRRAIQAIRSLPGYGAVPMRIQGRGVMGAIALYASLFEPDVVELDLEGLPASHREGPVFLNVSRHLEMPQAVAMAVERSVVRLRKTPAAAWEYPLLVARRLGSEGKLSIEPAPAP